MVLRFSLLVGRYGIYQFPETAPIPTPTTDGLWSFTRAEGEVTIICLEGGSVGAGKSDEGWLALKLHGPFEFTVTGILAEISRVLAEASIPLMALSTFDTDYVLVKQAHASAAQEALTLAGHEFL